MLQEQRENHRQYVALLLPTGSDTLLRMRRSSDTVKHSAARKDGMATLHCPRDLSGHGDSLSERRRSVSIEFVEATEDPQVTPPLSTTSPE